MAAKLEAPRSSLDAAGRGGASTVGVYAAMRSEVDLRAFVEAAFDLGWKVCFPCMVRDAEEDPARMQMYRVERRQMEAARADFLDKPLRCLAGRALEQKGYAPVAPAGLDALVVPLVAFDDEGHRLGYGGGNYDRILPRLRPDALVAGVGFDEQRVDSVPCEEHDVVLPRVFHA